MNPNRRAFTLVELLVAVALAALLVSVMAVLFFRTTSTVMAGEARILISQDGRNALDRIALDLENAVPTASQSQRFHASDGPGDAGLPDGSEARDALAMVCLTTVPDGAGGRTTTQAVVEYFLADDSDAELAIVGGVASGVRSGRPLKALKRRVWRTGTAGSLGAVKGVLPMDASAATSAGLVLVDESVMHQFVMSMNLEVFEAGAWRELHDAGSAMVAALPIGDVAGDPGMPRKVRLTLRVVEGAGENCERLFQRECWIPAE